MYTYNVYTMYISLRIMYMGYSTYTFYRIVAGQAPIVTILPICSAASTQAPCGYCTCGWHVYDSIRFGLHAMGFDPATSALIRTVTRGARH